MRWTAIFLVACGVSAPDDIDYPPLPDRHARSRESADANADAALLGAIVDDGDNDSGARDGSVDGGAGRGACATEIEPNDRVPNTLSMGRACGTIVDGADVDRFLFVPTTKTRLTFSASGLVVFYVGELRGGSPRQLEAGDSIEIDASGEEWMIMAVGPKAGMYSIWRE